MKPLQQWLCDECGKLIESPMDGWLEWLSDNKGSHSFRIVHHFPASPIRQKPGCYAYDQHPHQADNHLATFLGIDGLSYLLVILDLHKANQSEMIEIIRRLHLPYYEEARCYIDEARADGSLDGANEVYPYIQEVMKGIVERYSRS